VTRRALLLDFGGVITTDFYGALRSFCIREGLPEDAIEVTLRTRPDIQSVLKDAECGRVPQADLESVLGEALGISADGLVRRAGTDLHPCEQVLSLAARARERGLPVGVLSNSWGSGTDGYDAYAGYDLDNRFDVVVISDQVGMSKPDEDIYRLAAAKLGVVPEQCAFADDNPSYLPPARALGMAVVHFTTPDTGVPEIAALLGLSLFG
jgi:putative hydrolase of the HAD superfamily